MPLQQERIAWYCCRVLLGIAYVTKMLGIAAKRDCEVSHISRIKPCMFLGDPAPLLPILYVINCHHFCQSCMHKSKSRPILFASRRRILRCFAICITSCSCTTVLLRMVFQHIESLGASPALQYDPAVSIRSGRSVVARNTDGQHSNCYNTHRLRETLT